MQRVALFGGTFDPVHNGHINSARELADKLQLSRVHMVPCYQPVHRAAPNLTAEQRLLLLHAACEGSECLHVDDRELRREGPSYSIDTLQSLRDEYGSSVSINMVMGADAFAKFTSWHRADDFLHIGNIVVIWRAGELPPQIAASRWSSAEKLFQEAMDRSHGALTSVQLTPWQISSTQIRAALSRGESIENLVPSPVLNIINDQQLYR